MSRKHQQFFICEHCGNIIGLINNAGVPLVCCGEPMKELVANTTDAAVEKHVPVVTVDGSHITVDIGSVPHPMIPEHYIMWVYLETEKGGQRKNFEPGDAPSVCFTLTQDDKATRAYAYCNLHSLWAKDIQ